MDQNFFLFNILQKLLINLIQKDFLKGKIEEDMYLRNQQTLKYLISKTYPPFATLVVSREVS